MNKIPNSNLALVVSLSVSSSVLAQTTSYSDVVGY